jgi:hypothetical protein
MGAGFTQFDLAGAVAPQPAAQQRPVAAVIQVERKAKLALAQHDGRGNTPPITPRTQRVVPRGDAAACPGEIGDLQQPPGRGQHDAAIPDARVKRQIVGHSEPERAEFATPRGRHLGQKPRQGRGLHGGFQRVRDVRLDSLPGRDPHQGHLRSVGGDREVIQPDHGLVIAAVFGQGNHVRQ